MSPKIPDLSRGDRLIVETFAGPQVTMEVVEVYYKSDHGPWAEGCLVYRKDMMALKAAGVPYKKEDIPKKCIGVIFEDQIIKRVPKRKRRRRANG